MFNGIKNEDGEQIAIPVILSKIVAELCDHYCKYPEQYVENERKLYDEHCADCPLNYLI